MIYKTIHEKKGGARRKGGYGRKGLASVGRWPLEDGVPARGCRSNNPPLFLSDQIRKRWQRCLLPHDRGFHGLAMPSALFVLNRVNCKPHVEAGTLTYIRSFFCGRTMGARLDLSRTLQMTALRLSEPLCLSAAGKRDTLLLSIWSAHSICLDPLSHRQPFTSHPILLYASGSALGCREQKGPDYVSERR